jgi:hypothetical protein
VKPREIAELLSQTRNRALSEHPYNAAALNDLIERIAAYLKDDPSFDREAFLWDANYRGCRDQ